VELIDPRHVDVSASVHEGELVARLPGTIVSVSVAVGDSVAAGATLMVVEAMKMEHAILAPKAGRVLAVHYARGDRVTEGAVLVEVSAEEA
jgi:biotin carboxyl carrier protein